MSEDAAVLHGEETLQQVSDYGEGRGLVPSPSRHH